MHSMSTKERLAELELSKKDNEDPSQSQSQSQSGNDLNLYQGAALLTADCLGTGILALPANLIVLGRVFGLTFLILQLPVNLYAGTILSNSAVVVEERSGVCIQVASQEEEETADEEETAPPVSTRTSKTKQKTYQSVNSSAPDAETFQDQPDMHNKDQIHHDAHDTASFDFIGMTDALFHHPTVTHVVMAVYYCNIFLVLGDYILVMSHAVAALVGDTMCIPTAGLLASTLMFAVSQLRTMAKLGRSASIVSLTALFIVVIQCMVALMRRQDGPPPALPDTDGLLPKFSAIASIGFAVGSQKLFLNIRHEMRYRKEAPKALAMSLSFYVSVYVVICILAGPSELCIL
jgi:hypothetical protein